MWRFISKRSAIRNSLLLLLVCLGSILAILLYAQKNIIAYNIEYLSVRFSSPSQAASEKKAVSIPVLLYHGIVDSEDGINITKENFRNQMKAMKQAGYQTVGPEDLESFLKDEKELPDKSFVITFDDGRKDSFYPTDPILKGLEYSAVIFPIGSVVDKNKAHLTSSELKKLITSGRWEIGSHGFDDHHDLQAGPNGEKGHWLSHLDWLSEENRLETNDEYEKRIDEDMIRSKMFFREKVGIDVFSFAFPYNDYGQLLNNNKDAKVIIDKYSRKNYRLVFSQTNLQNGFVFNYPNTDPFMIKRIDVKPDWSEVDLMNQIEKGSAKSLPYSLRVTRWNGWTATRDRFEIGENTMTMGSGENNTGTVAFLDGSLHWTDYLFDTNVDWKKGSNFSLLSRFQNDSNYLSCNFSNGSIRLEQKINDETIILEQKKISLPADKTNLDLAMKIEANSASCGFNDQDLLFSNNIDGRLSHGGIGLKTWDPIIGNSEIIVKSISVK